MGLVFEVTSASADAPEIEAGFYDGRFESVEKKFIDAGQWPGDRYQWNFTLLDDDGEVLYNDKTDEPIVVDGLTGTSLNPNSKTKPKGLKFMEALLGKAGYDAWLNGEAKLDMDTLVGTVVQCEVYLRDNGWPSVSTILPKRTARRSGGRRQSAEE